MKVKLFSVILALFIAGSVLAQTNTPAGSQNFYEDLYGTVSPSRGAADALVYADLTLENDYVVTALTNLGFTVTVAADWTDFNTQLVSGNFGFAAAFNQNTTNGLSYASVQTYINSGGCMVYTDWTRDNGYMDLFEASWTGSTNSPSMTITDPVLGAGITSPMIFTNPGWGDYSMGLAPTGAGEVLAVFPSGEAAVVRGNGGRTIVLGYLSDTPPEAERQLLFENVVNSTLCGSGEQIPISNWAIFLGLFLIVSFAVIRFVKMS